MIGILVALLVSLAQTAPQPSGTIRGRVVDRDSGRPLFRAVVRVTAATGNGDERVTTTDERGTFALALPPGRYSGMVTAREHGIEPVRAGAITLARDEVVDVVVRLPPTYGLDVRVVDPSGAPLSGLEVRVTALDTGRTPFSSTMHGTDDLGHARLFGLPAGRYTLCAASDAIVFGSESLSRSERLLTTCYPSADEDRAEPVRIDRADLEGIEIRMRRGRTFTIAGIVVDAAGAPAASARVNFVHFIPNGSGSSGLMVDAAGRFRITRVAPGAYGISASIQDQGIQDLRQERRLEAGFVDVPVIDRDVDDLVVALKKTADVPGRLLAEDGASPLPPAEGGGFMIEAILSGVRLAESGGSGGYILATARADRTFTLTGMFGARLLRFLNVPRGWYVKSIRYGDDEIIDTPVEFKSGGSVDVVLSSRGAVVNGIVAADEGAPARATVCLFRLAGPRGIEIVGCARANAAGAFTLNPVRGGEYAVVALPPSSEVLPFAPQDRLSRLAELGERITLTDLDERSVRLRVVRER